MEPVKPDDIQTLYDQIKALQDQIKNAGEIGRQKLAKISVDTALQEVPHTDGAVDGDAWSRKAVADQQRLFHQLTVVLRSLHAAAGVTGPTDPKHIMSDKYASNTAIYTWGLLSFLLTAGLLYMVISSWGRATGTDFAQTVRGAVVGADSLDSLTVRVDRADAALLRAQENAATDPENQELADAVSARQAEAETQRTELARQRDSTHAAALAAVREIAGGGPTEGVVLTMVILLGALGGSIHLLGSLAKYVGNRKLKRSWLLYYLSMPFVGAALAPIVYMLLRVGLVSPSAAAQNGSAISNLNVIAIYAFAALTGMFAKVASDKLGEVFKTLFRTREPESTDALDSDEASGKTETVGD